MGKFFPPTVAEWHSSVVGFGAGFAYGSGRYDSDVARAAIRGVTGVEDDAGHLAQARAEAAYAAACFVVGTIVGDVWSRRRNN